MANGEINATDLTEETTSTLSGNEQFVMFDPVEGKRADIDAVATYIAGDKTQLQTTDKSSLVAAANELKAGEDDLKEDLRQKATVDVLNAKNLPLTAEWVKNAYYWEGIVTASSLFSYCKIPVENGKTYKYCGTRFLSKESTGIVNGTVTTPTNYVCDYDGQLYLTFAHNPGNYPQFFCELSDYDDGIGSIKAPTFNSDSLAQTDGQSINRAVSQKLLHDVAAGIIENVINEDTEDGRLSPLVIRTIKYEEGSAFVSPNWISQKYAWNTVGNKINIFSNNAVSYFKTSVSEGRIYFNDNPRFACVCDTNDYVLVSHNSQTDSAISYIDVPVNGKSLYITLANEKTSAFRTSLSAFGVYEYPKLVAGFGLQLPNYEEVVNTLVNNNANMFALGNRREKACKVGNIWYRTGAYQNFDTYWFEAEANKQYTFGCATRFFTVDDTLIYSSGTVAGFTYTPESDCIIWVCISRETTQPITCVAAPMTLDQANSVGVATLNSYLVAQETGTSKSLLMSQKAITDAIEQGNPTINRKLYGKGFATVSGSLSNGDTFNIPINNVKKNNVFSFVCKVTSFSSILIGHGKTAYDSSYIEITSTEVVRHNYTTSDSVQRWNHNLTISTYLNVEIQVGNGKAKIMVFSNGNSFSVDDVSWMGDANANAFVESVESTLTNCVFTWSSADFRNSVWIFGDSYLGFTGNSRWPYYLAQNGYLDNVLLNAFPGENTSPALTALNNMISEFGCPHYLVWCLGMNDGTDTNSTPSSAWMTGVNSVISICESNGITPIFATIPSVPGRTGVDPISHEGKNYWVRNSGYRYIDFAKAVESHWDGANTTWYDGMLSSDGVHPEPLGALALYYRAIADVPEITFPKP